MRICADLGQKNARVCAQTGGRAHSGRPRGRMRLRRIGRYAPRIGNHVVRTARRDLPIAGATFIPRSALCAPLAQEGRIWRRNENTPSRELFFFTKIMDEGGYYVDKTDVIPWLLSRMKQVVLFTRPRRFGKSTMMSMLKAFFE